MDAIINVDLQQAFPVPPAATQKIEERSREFPRLVFTKFLNLADSLFCRKLQRISCQPGSPERELILTPRSGDM